MGKTARKWAAAFVAVMLLVFASTAYAADEANVGLKAKATASTSFNDDNAAPNVIDAKKVEHGVGEWASKGELKPWLKLEWDNAVTIDRIVIFDRPNELDNANGGVITFSDGTTVDVMDVDPTGLATEVTFDAKTVTSLQYDINGAGSNVGLAEVQVFGTEAGAASDDGAAASDDGAAASDANPKTGDAGVNAYVATALGALLLGAAVFMRKKKSI